MVFLDGFGLAKNYVFSRILHYQVGSSECTGVVAHDLNHLMRCAGPWALKLRKLHHHLNAWETVNALPYLYYLIVPLNFGQSNFLEVRLCTVE